MKTTLLCGSFDNLRSKQVRFLQEASRLGRVNVVLWSDAFVRRQTGKAPEFPEEERRYFLEAIRYVDRVFLDDGRHAPDTLPDLKGVQPDRWVVSLGDDTSAKREFCRSRAMEYRVLADELLDGFPVELVTDPGSLDPGSLSPKRSARKRVVATGCFDWFHSGHIRFFEEAAELGDLYVVVGHDANIKLLKGEGHPMFSDRERRYMVQSVRFVKEALVSTGEGWLDAEPQIQQIQPDIYVVNEDGDRREKSTYCKTHAIEYRVLKRLPKEGLPTRQSTVLRAEKMK